MSAVSQSYRDQSLKSKQGTLPSPDKFSLLGLLGVIRNHDPDLASLSLGIDLTTLGLNLNSPDNLHKTFGSPWSDEPVKGDPEHVVPECYYTKPPPQLHVCCHDWMKPFALSFIIFWVLTLLLCPVARVFCKVSACNTVLYLLQVEFFVCYINFAALIILNELILVPSTLIFFFFPACQKMRLNFMLLLNCMCFFHSLISHKSVDHEFSLKVC